MQIQSVKDAARLLTEAQTAEEDMREALAECVNFVTKRDGQWEPEIVQKLKGRPRYTLDKVGAIVDQIHGELESANFTIKVSPADGAATDDNAMVLDGLIRHIRNISGAERIFSNASRKMLIGGMDGWMVVQDYLDDNCFDQDLLIKRVYGFSERVWFDPAAKEQDKSDAEYCFVLSSISKSDYKEKFGEDSGYSSVTTERRYSTYEDAPDMVTIGTVYYKKYKTTELVMMNNGAVYEVDKDYNKVKDELEAAGIVEEKRRSRRSAQVYSRIFNGSDWLTDEEETVFSSIPVIPLYGNYDIVEDNTIYRGVVDKLIDPQRIYNYATSRMIADTALSPVDKIFMTAEQAVGHEPDLKTMNINNKPVQLYNHVDGQQTPFRMEAPMASQGLQIISSQSSGDLNAIAGLFNANMGNNPQAQSGVAIDSLISQGDNSTNKWYVSMEIAICRTAELLIDAIPKVYDSTRRIRILQEDGSEEMVTINQPIFDAQTQTIVNLNDLSAGKYDAVCEIGQAFKSQRREAARNLLMMAQSDPSILQLAQDIIFKNMEGAGMNLVAERSRKMLLQQGVIPQEQMTDAELQELQTQQQQAAQNPQQDPNMMIAQAEMTKAQAEMAAQQNKQQELQLQAARLQSDIKAAQDRLQSGLQVDAAKIQQGQQRIDQDSLKIQLETQKAEFERSMKMQQAMIEQQKAIIDAVKEQAETMKIIKDAMGADAIMSPVGIEAYRQQGEILTDTQERL